jgi:hypothetical protein
MRLISNPVKPEPERRTESIDLTGINRMDRIKASYQKPLFGFILYILSIPVN